MSPWALLPAAAAALALGAWLSYHPAARAAWWFPAALAALWAGNALLWAWACRLAATDRELFRYSVAYDAATVAAYSVLPLAAFGVRPTPAAWAGLGLVVAGACLVKWGG